MPYNENTIESNSEIEPYLQNSHGNIELEDPFNMQIPIIKTEYDNEIEEAIYNYIWPRLENKTFLSVPLGGVPTKVYFADIDFDGEYEILLNGTYSSWLEGTNEVLKIVDNQIISLGGFYGFIENDSNVINENKIESIPYFMNSEGETVIVQNVCYNSRRITQTLTEVDLLDYRMKLILTKNEIINNDQGYHPDSYYYKYNQIKDYINFYSVQSYQKDKVGIPIEEMEYSIISREEYLKEAETYCNSLEYIGDINFIKSIEYEMHGISDNGKEVNSNDEYAKQIYNDYMRSCA